jgi:hypothetical protein
MLPLHPLATAIQADREREIRDRAPKPLGIPSGRRRPAVALSIESPARDGAKARGAGTLTRRPRVVFGGQG